MLTPEDDRRDAGDDRERRPCPTQRADDLARLLDHPAALRRRGPRASSRTPTRSVRTSGSLSGSMKPSLPPPIVAQLARGRTPRPGRSAGARCAPAAPPRRRRRRAGRSRCRPCSTARACPCPRGTRCRPRDARSSIAVVRARRDERAVHDERTGRRGQVGRRRRHEDRRVVQVDRVLAVAAPGEERPAGQPRNTIGAPTSPIDRVDLATDLQAGGVLRRRGGVDPSASRCRARRRSPRRAGTAPCRPRRSSGVRCW